MGVSGSVAAVKLPDITQRLVDHGFYVDVVLSAAGGFFQGCDTAPGEQQWGRGWGRGRDTGRSARTLFLLNWPTGGGCAARSMSIVSVVDATLTSSRNTRSFTTPAPAPAPERLTTTLPPTVLREGYCDDDGEQG